MAAPASAAEPVADSAAEARKQYELGTQAFAQKQYSEAAVHFESAAALKPNAVALYTAALAWDLAQSPERSADAYARSLDVPGLDPKQTASVRDRLAALEKTLGTLNVTGPEGFRVQLEGATEVGVPARLHGTPGVHALSVLSPNRPATHQDVTLEAGKVKLLDVKDEPPPPPPEEPKEVAPPPPPVAPTVIHPSDSFWTPTRVVGVGVLGAGVSALVAAAVLGTSANEAKDSYLAAPTRESFDHASSLQSSTNVALVSGLILFAAGVTLVVLPIGRSDRRVEVRAARGGLAVGGTF
jgi:hypothetical protein